jgi:NADPH:quinone reductase-like Zn-dependent oxidoreductase
VTSLAPWRRSALEVAEFSPGDEVLGFTDRRASHAEYVVAEAQNLTRKPANVSWEVAGSLLLPEAQPMPQCAPCP